MNLKSITVSEGSQTQMTSYCMITFMCNSRKNYSMESKSGGQGWRDMFKGKRKAVLNFLANAMAFLF